MSLILHFPKNEAGRDFAVGDIHGCFHKLHDELKRIGFREEVDRLFSVGDLVDRGPYSEEAAEWIGYPWFHAVRGNHEQMAIGVAAGKHDRSLYCLNGGGWFVALSPERQKVIASIFDSLPVAIEVEVGGGKVGIVHAEVPRGSWTWFSDQLRLPISKNKRSEILEIALWSRARIACECAEDITGVLRVYVGHTPVKSPKTLGNVHYIDTGAVYGRELTVVQIA